MRALITNDDGIEADGLAALIGLAERYFEEIWVVAPMTQMSEIGHRVTTQETIRYDERGERRFAIGGTPADCARIALAHLMPEKPDWILSGINHGGNLGRHDFVISGTVAAVREASFAGVRGVAFSHFMKRGNTLDWDRAANWAGLGFESLMNEETAHGEFWTVNLPHPGKGDPEPEVQRCEQERHPLLVSYETVGENEVQYVGDYHGRPRKAGSDVDVCFSGNIAVSKASV
ncbi:MAG: 5'/3'-nucleotidase SurE [Verrucomicrobiales bacterium]|nr:5'/3'-nucleotidase SurE [Verrucomicrobiales bacterium]